MPRGYARYALVVMVGINFLNYLDRYVPAGAGVVIQKEFHLSDTDTGRLATAFLLVYAIGVLPIGFWADRWIRRTIVGIGVTVWSLGTFFSAAAQNYTHLFLGRAVVGVGEASYYPAGTSLLSDYFPKARRAMAMAIWNVGTALGIAVGFAGGGIIAGTLGWRAAFLLTGIPGLLFAFLAFRLREPLRGAAEARGPHLPATADATLRNFVRLLGNPTLVTTILSQAALFFVLAANAYWLSFFLNRRFGLSVGAAGTLAGGVLVIGGLVGPLAGALLAERLARRSDGANLMVGILGFVLGAVFVSLALLAPSLGLFFPMALLGVFSLYLYAGPFTAVSQNVVIPSLRASSVTLTLFLAHLLGDAFSPLIVGALSDSVHDLRLALLIVSPTMLLVAAAFAALGLRTIGRDTRRAEETWAHGPLEPVPTS